MDLRILNNGEPSATISSDFTAPVHTPKSSVEGTPPASSLPGTSHEDLNRDAPLNKRDLRKRTYNAESDSTHDPLEDTLKPLTDEKRRSWKGWVELESDPVSPQVYSGPSPTRILQDLRKVFWSHLSSNIYLGAF